jgi:hypothetical protein
MPPPHPAHVAFGILQTAADTALRDGHSAGNFRDLHHRLATAAALENIQLGPRDIMKGHQLIDTPDYLIFFNSCSYRHTTNDTSPFMTQSALDNGNNRIRINFLVNYDCEIAAKAAGAFLQDHQPNKPTFWATISVFGDHVVATGPVECFPFPPPVITFIN